MTVIDQSGIAAKTRSLPISPELEKVLKAAGQAAGIDSIIVTSGGQPPTGKQREGSTRHDFGRAADLYLVVAGHKLRFSNRKADERLRRFVVAAAAHGANGIGAGVNYMGDYKLHIGFGRDRRDKQQLVWGARGRSVNAPQWLRDAAVEGWQHPPAWVFAHASESASAAVAVNEVQLEFDETEAHPEALDAVTIRAVQEQLTQLGYKLGRIDGIIGALTESALLAFQRDNDLPPTGLPDAMTRERLTTAAPRALAADRVTATEETLVKQGSVIARDARYSRWLGWITAALGAVGVGNSAVVNSAAATRDTSGLEQMLVALRQLPVAADPSQAARISEVIGQMQDRVPAGGPGAEALELMRLVLASGDPVATTDALGRILAQQPDAPMRTVLDLLPGFFASGSVLEAVAQGIAGLGSSLLPNFAGSLTLVGIGLIGRHLSNRISAARVRDQRSGANLNPLNSTQRSSMS